MKKGGKKKRVVKKSKAAPKKKKPSAGKGSNSNEPPQFLEPMPEPSGDKSTKVTQVHSGPPLAPITRVTTFSADEWEDFIREWAHSLKSQYHTVMRCSGAGDMGRDVVAHTGKLVSEEPWDNYQCKHYDHALRPTDIWIELGKLVYHTFNKEFTVPREYFFVSPHDVGTKLARLLEQPEELREGLIENWTGYCEEEITKTKKIKLSGKFRKHLDAFPFEIVTLMPVLKVIEQHRETPWHIHRFGGGFPDRPKDAVPPPALGDHELKYASELMKAYSDHHGSVVDDSNIDGIKKLSKHFLLSRTSFYSAESLKSFSRDHLDKSEYPRLQDEICDGVQEAYLDEHDDGLVKVNEVVNAAKSLHITDHPLISVLKPADRRGICHQLVDLDKLRWTKDDG